MPGTPASCLPAWPVEEDALAPVGWASSAGPGGPGKWLSALLFLFLLLFSVSLFCFGKNTKTFYKIPKTFMWA
jgi:hypothetical protein